jgi:hypothetical protein
VGATTSTSRSSASAKTTSSDVSVFERLYAQRLSKNTKSKTDWSVQALSPAESLERRLAYTPPSKSRPSGRRSNNSSRPNNSVASAPTSTSVYERLYRNEPRKRLVMVKQERKTPSNRRQRGVPQIPVPLHLRRQRQMQQQQPKQRVNQLLLKSENVVLRTSRKPRQSRRKKLHRLDHRP